MDYYQTTKNIDKERIVDCLERNKLVDLTYFVDEGEMTLWYNLYQKDNHQFCYEIKEDRCDTFRKLLRWIKHLSEKIWVTHEHIYQLICLYQIHNETNFREDYE